MEFLHNDKETFLDVINLASQQKNILPEIVEKDYYVTMILKMLAERIPFIVFKGGTSLSKCYKAINRFSEDIDITIDQKVTQGQRKKIKKVLQEIIDELGLEILNIDETRSRRDYNKYIIGYDSVLGNEYTVLKSTVILETVYMIISFPTNEVDVSNYIGTMLNDKAPELIKKFNLENFKMKTQCIERTFIDKVFALCDYYLQNKINNHSRHIYDLYKLFPLIDFSLNFQKLISDVRNVRKNSDVCLSCKNQININDLLNEIVNKNIYKADYQMITEKLLAENILYDEAVSVLNKIIDLNLF